MFDFARYSMLQNNIEKEKFDNFAHKTCSKIKSIAKFFVALILYIVLNVALYFWTNNSFSFSLEIFRLVENGLRLFLANNVGPLASFILECKAMALASTIVACLSACTIFGCFAMDGRTLYVEQVESRSQHDEQDYQEVTTNNCHTSSYKLHVQFLS